MEENINLSEKISLTTALTNQNSTGRPVKTLVGVNTGNPTLTLFLTLYEVEELTEVANEQSKNSAYVAQRKLDIDHAQKIASYTLKGLLFSAEKTLYKNRPLSKEFENIKKELGTQPYMSIPPLVASYRKKEEDLNIVSKKGLDGEVAGFKLIVSPGDTFWIVDGQHRRKGLELVNEFIKYVLTYHKYPTKGAIYKSLKKDDLTAGELRVWDDCNTMMRNCSIAMEVHIGLDADEERQLFHDLNNLGKKVDKNLALNFDGSNPVNLYTGAVVINDIFAENNFHESTAKDSNDWKTDGFTRQEIVSINALLFLNKTNINGATPSITEPKEEVANRFWEKIVQIPGILEEGSKQKTVAAQRVTLKALAKLVYDFAFGKFTNKEQLDLILNKIPEINFSHENPVWRYYTMTEAERKENKIETLEAYLPENEEANRDLGNYDSQNKTFRFGSKHNDIYPIIGDIIRWELNLPSRKKNS